MKAYLVVDLTVHDNDTYQQYVKDAPGFVAKHGGKYLVRGGDVDIIEGEWSPSRVVVLEFPDKESLDGLIADQEYQKIAATRRAATTTHMIAVQGCAPPELAGTEDN